MVVNRLVIKPQKIKVTLPYPLTDNEALDKVFAMFDTNLKKAGIKSIELELKLNYNSSTTITAKLKTLVNVDVATIRTILIQSIDAVGNLNISTGIKESSFK